MSENDVPGTDEMPGPEELPDAAWLARLQELIRESAAGAPTATEFAERLLIQGARLVAQASRSGRVSGVSYEYEGHVVKGSVLGPAYTWSGLQKKLGVTYVRQRDQAAMEGRLELPSVPVPGEARDAERQAPLPLGGKEGDAHPRLDEQRDEFREISPPESLPPLENSTIPPQGGEFDLSAEMPVPAEKVAAAESFPAAGGQPQGADAEPWEEWAAELEQETGKADADQPDASSAKESEDHGGSVESPVAPMSGAVTVTVETEQWQALVSAVGELRDQVRSWDIRLAQPSSEHVNSGDDPIREQISALTSVVRQASQDAKQATEALHRTKQESLWLSITSASVAGLVAALLVGLWFSQSAAERVDEMQHALIQHMEKQAAEDPLRQYFDRIVKKLQQP